MLFISCDGEYPKKIVGNYIIDYDGNSYTCLFKDGQLYTISGDIVLYSYDSTFITVKQKPVQKITDSIQADINYTYTLDEIEKGIKEYKKFCYWIVQISNDSLIGPLNKSEFEITRKKLKISDELRLD